MLAASKSTVARVGRSLLRRASPYVEQVILLPLRHAHLRHPPHHYVNHLHNTGSKESHHYSVKDHLNRLRNEQVSIREYAKLTRNRLLCHCRLV